MDTYTIVYYINKTAIKLNNYECAPLTIFVFTVDGNAQHQLYQSGHVVMATTLSYM